MPLYCKKTHILGGGDMFWRLDHLYLGLPVAFGGLSPKFSLVLAPGFRQLAHYILEMMQDRVMQAQHNDNRK